MLLNKKWLPFGIALLCRIFWYSSDLSSLIFIGTGLFYASSFSFQSIKNVRYGIFGIDLLVTIASLGAVFVGEYWEFASVTFLYVIGNDIEKNALLKTNIYIEDLLNTLPTMVRLEGGKEISLQEVNLHDKLVFKTGDVCGVDGIIVSGSAQMNEASITGESIPVLKRIDEKVYAGSIVDNGQVIVSVESMDEETVFGQIIELVEVSKNTKQPIQKWMDVFSKYYTLLILSLTVLTFVITRNVHTSLALLVVSCPGALVIAIPIINAVSLEMLAKHNVLVKHIAILDSLYSIETIAFDKTGTLTNNQLKIVDIYSNKVSMDELLQISASLEQWVNHPLGDVIVKENKLDLYTVEDFTEDFGLGVSGIIQGVRIKVGQENYFDYEVPSLEKTVVYVGNDTELLGYIQMEDELRDNAKDALEKLSSYHTIILTGDVERVSEDIAHQLQIDQYKARLLPKDKLNYIRNEKNIMMVGDGINDAPALMEADVGISMGGSENRVALETADIILMDKNLENISLLLLMSKKIRQLTYENIMIALITVVILVYGVLSNYVNMGVGMFVHELSIILVIMNALRLRRI